MTPQDMQRSTQQDARLCVSRLSIDPLREQLGRVASLALAKHTSGALHDPCALALPRRRRSASLALGLEYAREAHKALDDEESKSQESRGPRSQAAKRGHEDERERQAVFTPDKLAPRDHARTPSSRNSPKSFARATRDAERSTHECLLVQSSPLSSSPAALSVVAARSSRRPR